MRAHVADVATPIGHALALDGETGEISCADDSAPTVVSLYFDVAPQSLDGAQRLTLLRTVAGEFGIGCTVV